MGKVKPMKSVEDKGGDDQFNLVGYSAPCFPFFVMQFCRLLNLLINFIVLAFIIYINVKKCFIYIHIWAQVCTVLALGYLFISSGRQVIERKLEERNEPVAENEKSQTWKQGVFWYTVALPLVLTSNLLFFLLLRKDLIYSWEYDYSDDGKFGWRIYLLYLSHVAPLVGLLQDFFMNRIRMQYTRIFAIYLITIIYFLFTYLGQAVQ